MKTMNITVCTLFLSLGALSVNAAGVNDGELERCKSQLSEYYGEATEMRYVSKRQFRDGMQMHLAIHREDPATGYSTSQLASCWLGAENFQAYAHDGEEAVVTEVLVSMSPASQKALP